MQTFNRFLPAIGIPAVSCLRSAAAPADTPMRWTVHRPARTVRLPPMVAVDVISMSEIVQFSMLNQRFSSPERTMLRLRLVLAPGIFATVAGGCASDYSRRADISSVQTIGVVVPPGSSDPSGAKDVMQLYNLSVGEDRLNNAAVGAGAGAAAGTAAGVGTGIIGCTASGMAANERRP
jgi:hypothetical protein